MIVVIKNGPEETSVTLRDGSNVGSVREQHEALEEVGAPASYTFAVNGNAAPESQILRSGDVVSFRPRTSEKGKQG